MNKNIAFIVLGGMAAAALGWLAASVNREQPAPVIIVQAPQAPAMSMTPAPAPEPVAAKPAPAPAPRPAARPAARPAPARPAPAARPTPAPEPAPQEPEPAREVRITGAEPAEAARTASEQPVAESRPAAPPIFPTQKLPPPPPRSVTIPAGTLITVRLAQAIESGTNSEGDAFTATLDQPLVVDGLVIAERGSRQQGKVSFSERSGRVKGRAAFGLELVALNTADGQRVDLRTEIFRHEAASSAGRDAAKAGVMAGIGAAIGAMAGGGRGAAIGAAAGGAAGAGTVMATRGQEARLPAETRISFRLTQPITLTEKLD